MLSFLLANVTRVSYEFTCCCKKRKRKNGNIARAPICVLNWRFEIALHTTINEFVRFFLSSGQSMVPKQTHQTQADATRRRGQSAATTVGRRQRSEELAPREQVETGDAEQRVGQRNAPLRGLAAVRGRTPPGRRDHALRRVQFRGGQRRLDDQRPADPSADPPARPSHTFDAYTDAVTRWRDELNACGNCRDNIISSNSGQGAAESTRSVRGNTGLWSRGNFGPRVRWRGVVWLPTAVTSATRKYRRTTVRVCASFSLS